MIVLPKYREFTSLTDEEIKYILTYLFHSVNVKIENIDRNKFFNEIYVNITTGGWSTGEYDENGHELLEEIEDVIILRPEQIIADFSIEPEEEILYKKYLFSKGICKLLKDNQFLGEEK